eukprot:s1691_g9.t1
MSPSAPAVHEESSRRAGAAYGSVGGLANGVSPAALPTSVPMLRHEAEYVNPSEMEGVLVTQEQMSGPGRGDLAVAEDAVVSAVQSVVPVQTTGASQASMEAAEALEDGSVHAMRADMDVRQGSSSLTVVRWISRLNDFLTAQGQSVLGYLRETMVIGIMEILVWSNQGYLKETMVIGIMEILAGNQGFQKETMVVGITEILGRAQGFLKETMVVGIMEIFVACL